MMVTQIEDAKGYKKKIGFEHIIETALGMQNVHEIASASKRNESLHFGVADYAASTRARTTIIGGVNPDYSVLTDPDEAGSREIHWGDMWHYAISRMVVAARANGLRPVDGPFGDFLDTDAVGRVWVRPLDCVRDNDKEIVFTPQQRVWKRRLRK